MGAYYRWVLSTDGCEYGHMPIVNHSRLCLSGKEPSIKRANTVDERKEKARVAARERRAKEFEYFQV